MMNERRSTVLIVEDELLIVLALRQQLGKMGLLVCGSAATAAEAVGLAQKYQPQLVLMDVRLRGPQDGVDAALAIHDLVGTKIIFMTGSQEPSMLARIQSGHPTAVLFKPTSGRQLETAIMDALRT